MTMLLGASWGLTLGVAGAAAVLVAVTHYKRCPPETLLAVIRRRKPRKVVKCVREEWIFVWPLFEEAAYLNLAPLPLPLALKGVPTRDRIPVEINCTFTVAFGTEPPLLDAALRQLAVRSGPETVALARQVLAAALTKMAAALTVEEISLNRSHFLYYARKNAEAQLGQLGLRVLNVT